MYSLSGALSSASSVRTFGFLAATALVTAFLATMLDLYDSVVAVRTVAGRREFASGTAGRPLRAPLPPALNQ